MTRPKRIAVVVSHPIQYYAPLYRKIAEDPSLQIHVLFASRIGLDSVFDKEFNVEVAWAMDLVSGYSHEFLPEAGAINDVGFWRLNNPSLTGVLARFQPDVVIIHGYGSLTALRALLWCRLSGVRAFMMLDGSTHAGRSGVRRHLKRCVLPVLLRQFDGLFTLSEKSEEYLAGFRFPRARMFRTSAMIAEPFWEARADREAIRRRKRAQLGLDPVDFAFLYVGKLLAFKRVADILEAMRLLPHAEKGEKRPILLVAGDGDQRVALEAMAAEYDVPVRFLGFVNVDGLPDLYCAGDCLVHPAELEQFGMVIVEASVIGLPLILSDRIGAIGSTSIARPGENAIVYSCGDWSELAQAMKRMLQENALCTDMGDASRRISQDHAGDMALAAVLAACK